MSPLNISTASLHWRLASTYGDYEVSEYDRENNICRYTRSVIRGVFVCLMLMLVGGTVSAALGDWVAWVTVMSMMQMYIEPNVPALVFTVTLMIVSAIVTYGVLGALLRKARGPNKQPSAVTQMYQSWKDKYCIPITVDKR